jgi:hypothetical protein
MPQVYGPAAHLISRLVYYIGAGNKAEAVASAEELELCGVAGLAESTRVVMRVLSENRPAANVSITRDDVQLILESLSFTKEKFESYQKYPTREFQDSRVADVKTAIKHVREYRDQLKAS